MGACRVTSSVCQSDTCTRPEGCLVPACSLLNCLWAGPGKAEHNLPPKSPRVISDRPVPAKRQVSTTLTACLLYTVHAACILVTCLLTGTGRTEYIPPGSPQNVFRQARPRQKTGEQSTSQLVAVLMYTVHDIIVISTCSMLAPCLHTYVYK